MFCTALAGRELSRFTGVLGLVPAGDRFPELGQQAPQYLLEELLRDVVRELPTCLLATGYTVTEVVQDDAGARVSVTGRDGLGTMEAEDYDGQSGATKEDSNDTDLGQSISVTSVKQLSWEGAACSRPRKPAEKRD